jgi:hypothetical protein
MLWLAVAIGIVVAAGVVLALVRRGRPAGTDVGGRRDRAALAARLRELAKRPAPTLPGPVAAACYGGAPSAEAIVEYVCPICNNRTLYPRLGADTPELPERERAVLVEVARIDETRRLADQAARLSNEGVALDETPYCKHCSPTTPTPWLTLVVALAGETPRRVEVVTRDDAAALLEFLKGEGARRPAPGTVADQRLARLLGVSAG